MQSGPTTTTIDATGIVTAMAATTAGTVATTGTVAVTGAVAAVTIIAAVMTERRPSVRLLAQGAGLLVALSALACCSSSDGTPRAETAAELGWTVTDNAPPAGS